MGDAHTQCVHLGVYFGKASYNQSCPPPIFEIRRSFTAGAVKGEIACLHYRPGYTIQYVATSEVARREIAVKSFSYGLA